MLPRDILVQLNPEPRPVWQLDVAVLNHRVMPNEEIIPPLYVLTVKLEDGEIAHARASVTGCERANRAADVMRGHRYVVCVRQVCDLLGFEQSSRPWDVGLVSISLKPWRV